MKKMQQNEFAANGNFPFNHKIFTDEDFLHQLQITRMKGELPTGNPLRTHQELM